MSQCFVCNNINGLPDIADAILNSFPENRIFIFRGDLGAGKTTLIKAICKKLNVTGLTNSPSFALVNEYPTTEGDIIYHFDFYRINNIDEIFDIGYEEYFYSGHYCFIEWPEIAEHILPSDYVEICIETKKNKQSRIISFDKKTAVV
ncbi:MAG TPA: tRNA (adenosine(37)-N6)-threonylcarbamoyltransferase complex ATPase subunit type 1 TsaE [Bacteroidales bacterium]|nr:tRNA (adenosine(37)-N6)-threonylcarbamoyltransferase complex ATPase subunit type 1 TsaE [Bacteroidales bacterium]